MKNLFIVLSIILIIISCNKGSENIPGSIIVDGKKLDLPYSLSVKEKTGAYAKGGYLIYLFNHNKNSCDDVTSSARQIKTGEISVRIFSDEGKSWSVVGIENHSQLGVNVRTLKIPTAIGDEVILNVPEKITFKPLVGKYKGQEVIIHGSFKGKYCGERKN